MILQSVSTVGSTVQAVCRAVLGRGATSSQLLSTLAPEGVERWQPLTTGYFAQPIFHVDRAHPASAATCVLGSVHSTEALSSTDGPGLRYVVVLGRPKPRPGHHIQGAAPGAGDSGLGGTVPGLSRYPAPPAYQGVSAILQDMQRILAYLTPNGGGVTASGAHPLQQHRFCEDLFHGAHDLGVTTCLHSQPPPDHPSTYAHVLHHTDSAIVQLNTAPLPAAAATSSSASDDKGATRNLTAYTGALEELAVPYHLRYLLVPDVTDNPVDIECLVEFARSRGAQLQGIQVMPHHLVTGSKRDMLGVHRSHRGFRPYSLEAALQLVTHINSLGCPAALAV